mmetsp:Transcript_1832/g.4235  ORF Transcript_1832/g.4235 Transcript_1832/m.4235 type:complete len:162 (-) Transcript_1832:454-939(-)
MSQQSLTFLSQSSGRLHKPPKKQGGCDQFHPGVAGSKLTLLHATEAHLDMIRSRDEEAKVLRQNAEPLGLKAFHYATMGAVRAERERLGCNDIPAKPIASIPGYSGNVPRREALNIIGGTHRETSLQAAYVFAAEQERARAIASNIKGPERDLQNPDTLRR